MPLLWLSLAFLLGILAAERGPWPAGAWLGLGAGALLLWPVLRRLPQAGRVTQWARWPALSQARLRLPPLLLLAAFACGGARYAAAHPALGSSDLASYNGTGQVELQGWVADDPDRRDQAVYLRLNAERIRPTGAQGPGVSTAWIAVQGQAQLRLPPDQPAVYGTRLALRGALLAPPPGSEDFSYSDYLARKGILSVLENPSVQLLPGQSGSWLLQQVYRLRAAALALCLRLFPQPESEFMAGILLGLDSGIPPELAQAFQVTGTAHILAISGFNMAILSALFLGLFGKVLNRWWAALAAVLALAGYTLLAGAGASVLRAALMCALTITAAQLGRSAGGFNALLFSAGLLCFFDPNLPWDISFQLTFAATLGLMLYAGPLQGWFSSLAARRLPGWLALAIAGPVGEYFLCTLAAQLTTLPLIVWHFARLSLVSLIANPLALPPQAPLMVLGALAVFLGLLWEPLGRLLALAAWPLAAYTTRLVEALGQVPGGQITLGPDGVLAVVLVCVLLAVLAALRGRLRAAVGWLQPYAVLLGVAGLALFAWRAALANPDGRLHLTIFDLDGGPAILLRSPEGTSLLSGGADSAASLERALGRRLPPLGPRLDGLLLTGQSGLDGLSAALAVIPAGRVYTCADLPALGAGQRLGEALRLASVPLQPLPSAQALRAGARARLSVLQRSPQACALELSVEQDGGAVFPNQLVIILPGPYGPQDLPTASLSPGALVLIARQDPSPWRALGLRVLSPPPGGWLEVQAGGHGLWVEAGQ